MWSAKYTLIKTESQPKSGFIMDEKKNHMNVNTLKLLNILRGDI